jgi:5-methylcytosine-specific restriction endonuclease McrA
MDLKSCSRCGKIHPRNYNCNVGRIYTKTDESRLRSRYAWTLKAQQIKNDAMGLCEVCKAQGLYNYDNLEVHHITKLKDDPNGLLDDNNLVCLCVYHHKQADDGEIDADYLRELAKLRQELGND